MRESVGYSCVTHVTVEVVNCHQIDRSIRAQQNAIDGNPLSLADTTTLLDTLSILKGIARNYKHGHNSQKVAIAVNKELTEQAAKETQETS